MIYCAVPYYTTLRYVNYIMLCSISSYAMSCYAKLSYAMLSYAMLCYVMYHAMPCHAIQVPYSEGAKILYG